MSNNEPSSSEPTADTREQGVDFGPLMDDIASHDYPATRGEIVEAYGDRELDLADGSKRLDEVLVEQSESGEETYDSPSAVKQAVLNMVGDEAVGRTDYSDRGGELPDESGEGESTEDQSL